MVGPASGPGCVLRFTPTRLPLFLLPRYHALPLPLCTFPSSASALSDEVDKTRDREQAPPPRAAYSPPPRLPVGGGRCSSRKRPGGQTPGFEASVCGEGASCMGGVAGLRTRHHGRGGRPQDQASRAHIIYILALILLTPQVAANQRLIVEEQLLVLCCKGCGTLCFCYLGLLPCQCIVSVLKPVKACSTEFGASAQPSPGPLALSHATGFVTPIPCRHAVPPHRQHRTAGTRRPCRCGVPLPAHPSQISVPVQLTSEGRD